MEDNYGVCFNVEKEPTFSTSSFNGAYPGVTFNNNKMVATDIGSLVTGQMTFDIYMVIKPGSNGQQMIIGNFNEADDIAVTNWFLLMFMILICIFQRLWDPPWLRQEFLKQVTIF